MEFIVNKQEIEKLLVRIQGVSEKRHAIPVLSHFLLEVSGGRVGVTATDLDIIIKGGVEADVLKDGNYLVPTRKMLDIVKVLPTDSVSVKLQENGFVEITSGKSRFNIAGLPAKEFPELPGFEEGESFTIQRADLKLMVDRVISFSSTEDTRLEIAGVFFEKIDKEGDEKLRLVATDGHRLSYVEEALQGLPGQLEKGIIVPRKGVGELRKMLDEGGGEVAVSVGESFISTGSEGFEITIRLIDAEFPAYREVVPESFTRKVVVNRESFSEVLRRVSVIAAEKLKTVVLELKDGEIEVSSLSPDYGEASDFIEASLSGDSIKVGFNSKYLLDVTSSSGGESLVMEISNELSPVLMTPEGRDDYVAVVMPIRTTM